MSEYSDEYYSDEEYAEEYVEQESGFEDFLQHQIQKTPWWLISLVFHVILAFICMIIQMQPEPEKILFDHIAKIEAEPIKEIKPEPKRAIFKPNKPVKIDQPTIKDPVVKEAKVDETKTINNEPFDISKGNKGLSDSPLQGKFSNSFIGGGGSAGGLNGRSFGAKKNLVQSGGGSKLTEDAVLAGLKWLKRHQAPDGRWDADGFSGQCGSHQDHPGSCGGQGSTWVDTGLTGLAVLCFLGAGNTTTIGEFKEQVKKGVRFLKSVQDQDGCFGQRIGHYMYNHSIAALAMAEAYTLSNYNPLMKTSAQKGIDFLVKSQNPGLGWRYGYQDGENDTSVTGWCVMALKSAKVGELNVPSSAFDNAMKWIDSVTDEQYYRTGYMEKGDVGARVQGSENFSTTEAMTAAGMTSRVFAGEDRNNPKLQGGAGLLSASPPNWGNGPNGKSQIDFYYWYYGTLAMFQLGGDSWKHWNSYMKKALLENQKKDGCLDGSWDPVDPWGQMGSRIYATAINVLSLEIYYRYAKVFK